MNPLPVSSMLWLMLTRQLPCSLPMTPRVTHKGPASFYWSSPPAVPAWKKYAMRLHLWCAICVITHTIYDAPPENSSPLPIGTAPTAPAIYMLKVLRNQPRILHSIHICRPGALHRIYKEPMLLWHIIIAGAAICWNAGTKVPGNDTLVPANACYSWKRCIPNIYILVRPR